MVIVNYLAHIFLSGEERQVQIGNFMGDAVKGKAYLQYPLAFQQGILLHRHIDAFCDAHPLVREAVGMGKPLFGRYAGVVTDVFFDYFLATAFRNYSPVSLGRYTRLFYVALLWNYCYLPPRIKGFLWHFIATDRLGRYATLQGIQNSLFIMARYRGLQVEPTEAVRFLQLHEKELRFLFSEFFVLLQAECLQQLHILKSR